MSQTAKNIQQEIDELHAGVMAIEEILLKQGIASTKELNRTLKQCRQECQTRRSRGETPKIVD